MICTLSFLLNRVIKLRVFSWTGYVFQDLFCPKQGQGFNTYLFPTHRRYKGLSTHHLLVTPLLAWENSQLFMKQSLVSPLNKVWGMRAEIPHWWYISTHSTQIWVVIVQLHACAKPIPMKNLVIYPPEKLLRPSVRPHHWKTNVKCQTF